MAAARLLWQTWLHGEDEEGWPMPANIPLPWLHKCLPYPTWFVPTLTNNWLLELSCTNFCLFFCFPSDAARPIYITVTAVCFVDVSGLVLGQTTMMGESLLPNMRRLPLHSCFPKQVTVPSRPFVAVICSSTTRGIVVRGVRACIFEFA